MHYLILFSGFLLIVAPYSLCQTKAEIAPSKRIEWSIPSRVIDDSGQRTTLFFHVESAETESGVYAFGNTLLSPTNPGQYGELLEGGDEPLIATGPGGRRIGVPEGPYSFTYPRAAADTSGTVHLLWGEPDTPFSKNPNSDFKMIWHARYTDGRWSDPAAIYKAAEIVWKPNLTSDFFVDNRGVFHLLFVTTRETPAPNGIIRKYTGIMHLFKDEKGWQNTFWTSTRAYTCPYVDLAVGHAGRLFMACIGPDLNTEGDQNSVFFTSSDDRGKSWSKPELISLSGPGLKRAIDPQIEYTSNGTIHLVWGKSLDRGILPETIGHAWSNDSGKTWSDVHLLEPHTTGSILKLDMAADPEGNLHLVYSSRNNLKKYHTYHRKWNGKTWTSGRAIHPGDNLWLYGKLLIRRNGELYLPVVRLAVTDNEKEVALPTTTLFMIGKPVESNN